MTDAAQAAGDAIHRLCRTMLHRPSVKPADVDLVLAHLAEILAALPQIATQLGDILGQAKDEYALATDSLIEAQDPDAVIITAQLHLEQVGEPAFQLHRLLDAAHNQTAHLSATERLVKPATRIAPDVAPLPQRPDETLPWPTPARGSRPRPSR